MMHLGKAQPEDAIGLCKIEPAYFANASVGLLGLPSQLRGPLKEVPLRLTANALFILKGWTLVLLFRRGFIRLTTRHRQEMAGKEGPAGSRGSWAQQPNTLCSPAAWVFFCVFLNIRTGHILR